jgi:hypothetical protein
MKVLFTLAIFACIIFNFTQAQDRPDPNIPQGTNFEVPEGWEVRLDHGTDDVVIGAKPDSSDIYFVNMTPGWHITTGPACIFYHPANTASGSFGVKTELHFFNPGERNREGYGLFWGGSNLDDDTQAYMYFLVRNTGEFLIKKRTGKDTEVIQDWTASDVINIYDDQEVSSVLNVLQVRVEGEHVRFIINDEEVADIDASGMNSDGIYGLRVNHSVNLHVSDLSLSKL